MKTNSVPPQSRIGDHSQNQPQLEAELEVANRRPLGRPARATLTALSAALLLGALGFGLGQTKVAQANEAATKVRAIDLDKVIQKSSKAKEITREFQRFQQQKQDELRKEQAALEQEQRKLSQNSSQAEIDAYGKKMQATARKLQEAEIEAQKRFAATRGKLLKALEPTLEAFAKDNGIGLLLDSNTGGVVYVAPSWDNTSQLLPRIN
jgi:Skp family chaperone for outer membrane proteins